MHYSGLRAWKKDQLAARSVRSSQLCSSDAPGAVVCVALPVTMAILLAVIVRRDEHDVSGVGNCTNQL